MCAFDPITLRQNGDPRGLQLSERPVITHSSVWPSLRKHCHRNTFQTNTYCSPVICFPTLSDGQTGFTSCLITATAFWFFLGFFFKGVCTTHVLPVLEKALHMQIHWQEKTAVTYKKQTQENKIEISVLQIIVKSGLLLYTHLSRTWTNLFWRGTGVPLM